MQREEEEGGDADEEEVEEEEEGGGGCGLTSRQRGCARSCAATRGLLYFGLFLGGAHVGDGGATVV